MWPFWRRPRLTDVQRSLEEDLIHTKHARLAAEARLENAQAEVEVFRKRERRLSRELESVARTNAKE